MSKSDILDERDKLEKQLEDLFKDFHINNPEHEIVSVNLRAYKDGRELDMLEVTIDIVVNKNNIKDYINP